MDTVTIKAKGISVTVDLTVGHIADMTVDSDGRQLKPLHRAPWIDAGETLPPDLPEGTVRLSGTGTRSPAVVRAQWCGLSGAGSSTGSPSHGHCAGC